MLLNNKKVDFIDSISGYSLIAKSSQEDFLEMHLTESEN
jgi:hypothetical protein